MKKFLFTLAALLMAGSMVAENYLYMEDFEVSQELLAQTAGKNRRMDIPLKAHFDNRVSAFTVTLTLPEGVDLKNAVAGPDLNINTLDAVGNPKVVVNDVNFSATDNKIIVACVTAGYYYPEGADPDEDDPVTCLAAKWEPGDYDCMVTVTLQFAQEFTGGDLIVKTEPSSGQDPRGNTCPKNEVWEKTCVITVEGGSEPEKTETPVITYDEDTFTVTATGAGEVKLYVNGVEVENPYTFELGEEETTYTVTATAQEDGKEISETAELEVTVPAAPVVIEVTPKPIIDVFDDPEAQTVTVKASGYGHICIYWDDMLQAEGEGEAVWVIPYGDDPEGEEYGVSATAQEEGKEVSEYALETVFVPGKSGEEPPYETPAPEVNTEMTDDAFVITATGEGTVTVYVQYIDMETGAMTTETYEGEGTVTVTIPRGEEDAYINYWAVAQADEDAVPGETDVTYFFEVPAKETEPVDPEHHDEGVWIVTIGLDGAEWWDEMMPSAGDYTCIVRLGYGRHGHFPYDPNKTKEENDAIRPDIHYYIVIDGVRYGAEEDGTITNLGEAVYNPLFENENTYVLEHALGRTYNMGVAIDQMTNEILGVYAAVAPGYTELEEMNASKTVAGVRYFNMAGQEMQEANGMTIVVTTYTDGTTSAVKVIK